jgi:hypothetical protein
MLRLCGKITASTYSRRPQKQDALYRPFQIEGFAIASTDGMLVDYTGLTPSSLKLEADQRLFRAALDRADDLIHGRLSHEGQPNWRLRRRLISRQGMSPETVLAGAGLHVAVARALEEQVSLAIWVPEGAPAPDY